MPNKSNAYLLTVEPNNLVLLKTYNTEFDENGRPLEIEGEINLTVLINN